MPKLTHRRVQTLREPGRYADGGNLYLQITSSGSRSWAFRYMRHGKARQMGLGPVDLVSLSEARETARTLRRQLFDGIDPLEIKHSSAPSVTFEDAATRLVEALRPGWKNAKHAAQWPATLQTYAFPVLGAKAVDQITTDDVLACLEPIWTAKPETASRLRGRIQRVLDFAATRGWRKGENPARWTGHLAHMLPARSKVRAVRNHASIPWQDMPAFWTELTRRDSLSALALQFTILCAARTSETIGATWSELDDDVWTIPGSRMKAGVPHRIPLVPAMVAVLNRVPRFDNEPRIFPVSNMAQLELLRGMQPGKTVHGFRASFKTWALEHTAHPREIIEHALAHTIVNKAEAAYIRGDALEKRRRLMIDWAEFLAG